MTSLEQITAEVESILRFASEFIQLQLQNTIRHNSNFLLVCINRSTDSESKNKIKKLSGTVKANLFVKDSDFDLYLITSNAYESIIDSIENLRENLEEAEETGCYLMVYLSDENISFVFMEVINPDELVNTPLNPRVLH